jgi:hypothetical protein
MKTAVRIITIIAFAFLIVGGINFLVLGLFNYNMFAAIFVNNILIRINYVVIGIAALWTACWLVVERSRLFHKHHNPVTHSNNNTSR